MTFKNFIKYFIAMPLVAIVCMMFMIICFVVIDILGIWLLFFMWSSSDSEQAQQGFWLYHLDSLFLIYNDLYDGFLETFYKSYYKANEDFLWELKYGNNYNKYRTFHKSLSNLNVFAYRCKSLFKRY